VVDVTKYADNTVDRSESARTKQRKGRCTRTRRRLRNGQDGGGRRDVLAYIGIKTGSFPLKGARLFGRAPLCSPLGVELIRSGLPDQTSPAYYGDNYLPFLEKFYRRNRSTLFDLLDVLPLVPTTADRTVFGRGGVEGQPSVERRVHP
jgi:hypothetical protein